MKRANYAISIDNVGIQISADVGPGGLRELRHVLELLQPVADLRDQLRTEDAPGGGDTGPANPPPTNSDEGIPQPFVEAEAPASEDRSGEGGSSSLPDPAPVDPSASWQPNAEGYIASLDEQFVAIQSEDIGPEVDTLQAEIDALMSEPDAPQPEADTFEAEAEAIHNAVTLDAKPPVGTKFYLKNDAGQYLHKFGGKFTNDPARAWQGTEAQVIACRRQYLHARPLREVPVDPIKREAV